MPVLTRESEHALSEGKDGDHFVLWYRTAKGRARAVSKFLSSCDKGSSLVAIILPLRELRETEMHLREEGYPIGELMKEGRLQLFASEEFLPTTESDYKRLGAALRDLRRVAKAKGLKLLIIGRIAPVLFERGEIDKAMMVEEIADSSLGNARLLCLYDDSGRKSAAVVDTQRVDHVHTRTLREMESGYVEMVGGRKRRAGSKPKRSKSR